MQEPLFLSRSKLNIKCIIVLLYYYNILLYIIYIIVLLYCIIVLYACIIIIQYYIVLYYIVLLYCIIVLYACIIMQKAELLNFAERRHIGLDQTPAIGNK